MTLTVALALFGAAVLAAMAAHLWWQARRAQPRRVLTPRSESQREPGSSEGGVEPSFDAPTSETMIETPAAELRPARGAAAPSRAGAPVRALTQETPPAVTSNTRGLGLLALGSSMVTSSLQPTLFSAYSTSAVR